MRNFGAKIAASSNAYGGEMTIDDLAAHAPDWCGTISKKFDDVTLHEIPPNGQGIAALMALGILSHTVIRELDADDPRAIHLQIEAMKLALMDTEGYVADIDYMAAVTAEDLLNDDYLAARAKLIDLKKAQEFGVGAPKNGGTVYLTAADESGMMVSFIQSNYAGFGSGVVVPGTGIHLQNRGFGFSLDVNSPNYVGPNKRPFQTIIPGFLMAKDKPIMSFGVMGGPMQAQGHLQMVLRISCGGKMCKWPLMHRVGGLPKGWVSCETTLSKMICDALKAMGHGLSFEAPDASFGFGGAQLIHRLPDGGYAGGSDPRKDGMAVGY